MSDSAGVRVVLNADAPLPKWTVDSVPVVDIGALEGPPGHDLALPWSSTRLADGRIAISNGQISEMRIFTADGDLVRAVGREGEGPGEFTVMAALRRLSGDTIVVSDAVQSRLTVFTPDGDLVRTIQLEPLENRGPRLRGVIGDTLGVWGVTIYERSGGTSRAVRDQLLLALRPIQGGNTTVIGQFAAAEKFNQVMPHGGIAGWNQPFSRNTHTAVGQGIAWVGQSEQYELRGYSGTGELVTIARLDRSPSAVGPTERDRFFQHELDEAESDDLRKMYTDVHRIITYPETMPAFSALVADEAGNVWVKEYRPPWESGPATWRVFTSEGVAIAEVLLPGDLAVHEIGTDYVLGSIRDDLDVEHVRQYRLNRMSR